VIRQVIRLTLRSTGGTTLLRQQQQ